MKKLREIKHPTKNLGYRVNGDVIECRNTLYNGAWIHSAHNDCGAIFADGEEINFNIELFGLILFPYED